MLLFALSRKNEEKMHWEIKYFKGHAEVWQKGNLNRIS